MSHVDDVTSYICALNVLLKPVESCGVGRNPNATCLTELTSCVET